MVLGLTSLFFIDDLFYRLSWYDLAHQYIQNLEDIHHTLGEGFPYLPN